MSKKVIKYTGRIVWGLITLFWVYITLMVLFPDESYHHCEAGQDDMSPMTCAIIAVVSLIVFCYVWYKTKNEIPACSDIKDATKEMPKPFKSYLDFSKYMSELEWANIENEDEVATQSGFYLFNCRGDNHYFYEFYELEKGEKLCKYYLDHHFDGWAAVVPECYHIVDNAEGEYMMKNWVCIDNSLIFAHESNELIRFVDGKIYKGEGLVSFKKGHKWIIADSLLELRKIASRNLSQRITDIQQIEVVESIAESFDPPQGFINWKKQYLGFIECSEEEKEVLITNLNPDSKQNITKLQVLNSRAHLFIWDGRWGQYSYLGNVPLNTMINKVEEDVFDERYECKDTEMCEFLEKMEQDENHSFPSY